MKTAWVFYEYRDRAGIGDYKLFKDKDDAINYAKDEWDHMNRYDQRSYITDVAGEFWVAELPVEWDDLSGEFVPDFGEYTPVWDTIAMAK